MMRIALLAATATLLGGCVSQPPALPPPGAEVRPVVASDRLEGRWTVIAVDGKAVPAGPRPFDLELRADGSWSARFGCNDGGGQGWSRNGDKLFLPPGVITAAGCGGAANRLERRGFAILGEALTMELTPPNRLRLVNAVGAVDLVRYQGAD